MSEFLKQYRETEAERLAIGVPPKALNIEQTQDLIEELIKGSDKQEELLEIFIHRIPVGVDDASFVKAKFLDEILKETKSCKGIDKKKAIEILGTMQGGYNIDPLIYALDSDELGPIAEKELSNTILVFDKFLDIETKAKEGNIYAKNIIQSWADARWFLDRAPVADKITLKVYKVPGELTTDDLSPAPNAWSRPDIPLHALAMLQNQREGVIPDVDGSQGPIKQMEALKADGYPLAFSSDVLGTGSSRKSATNSLLWHIGHDIDYVPNKRSGGYVLAGKIAPIYFNTLEDSGALPIELDVSKINSEDIVDLYPHLGKVCKHNSNEVLSTFELRSPVLVDEARAGGRIPLIIGRKLTQRARASLKLPKADFFIKPIQPEESNKGYTRAQKIVGKACGVAGVRPGQYCEPIVTTVGSQDTTGPMTRDEIKDLACLKFSADLVMESFCHTAPYPSKVDLETQRTLGKFFVNRGGVSLKVGDGIIHSWLNRMILPETVGTGGDSHTRFPFGISFPAGSGLVAFAAAAGIMPIDMPESVLVKFKGDLQPGVTLRDLVHSIPYYAIQEGLLTVPKAGKKNIFSGKIIEIEGLEHLKAEQAFELADATAERSAAACTVKLSIETISEYIRSNVVLLKWMIKNNYQDSKTLERRISKMEEWLANPVLLEADHDAEYAAVLEIDINNIKEPILCAPNDPDDARLLSEVAGDTIDEVFIGSCMTNVGHFRAAGDLLEVNKNPLKSILWIAPPTKMDAKVLHDEGYYSIFGKNSARVEMPGCSLCMGNQAHVARGATVVSTSTRNFPNRLGPGSNVYLASAELAAVSAMLGRLPSVEEYLEYSKTIDAKKDSIYRYMNFDHMEEYMEETKDLIIKVDA
ncbi:MAG: bifunctional aconitate hydratase 2/2-methylisocitrate dehydratase [Psittacicella sp.]